MLEWVVVLKSGATCQGRAIMIWVGYITRLIAMSEWVKRRRKKYFFTGIAQDMLTWKGLEKQRPQNGGTNILQHWQLLGSRVSFLIATMSRHPSPGPSPHQPPSVSARQKQPKPYAIGIAAGAEDVKYQTKYKELKRKVKDIEAVCSCSLFFRFVKNYSLSLSLGQW